MSIFGRQELDVHGSLGGIAVRQCACHGGFDVVLMA